MQSLDDLARAAEEAEVTDTHSLPITDAELGETAAEGAQVMLDGNAPAPVVAPSQPLQMPTSTPAMPMEQQPVAAPITVPVVAPDPVAMPAATEPLAPFNAQITQDTAPVAAPAAQPVAVIPPQPTPVQAGIESPTPPPAPGTMPGQTVTPQSHIIADSFPKPTTGVDPLSGIAV